MQSLIDKAINVCGGVSKLAQRLEMKANVVSMHRAGRPLSPETACEMAHMTGDDVCEAAVIAMIFRAKGRRKATLEMIFKSKFEGVAMDKKYL